MARKTKPRAKPRQSRLVQVAGVTAGASNVRNPTERISKGNRLIPKTRKP